MGRLFLCWVAVVSGFVAQAQNPAVIGVANDPPSSPTVVPGTTGYVFGSEFGTVENTTVTVGGLKAEVIEVRNNQIRALFPPNLPAGPTPLTVTVDGRISETVNVIVSQRAPMQAKRGRTSMSAGPASGFSVTASRESFIDPMASVALSAAVGTTTTGPTGVVYTCDSTVTAANSTACNTLNSTIAGLYSSTFTNVSAAIYIKLGSTGLGQSDWVYNTSSYATFRSQFIASQSGPKDATAIADSVPVTNPFGSDIVEFTNPLARALGLGAPTSGLKADGTTFCTIGSMGCYDGIITISNSQPLYFRSGAIGGNQYDFFTVVEHETDEVLGTASCAFGDCGSAIFPADLFRYHSDKSRSQAPGSNASCAASNSTNACFSLDGIHVVQQYNNLNNGDDAGDWMQNCGNPHVQDAVMCSGTGNLDISPTAEIPLLDAIGYKLVSSVLQFYTVAPCRLVDTRGAAAGFNGSSPFSGPSIAAGATLTIPVQSASGNTTPAPCGTIPAAARAYSLNVTVVPRTGGAVDYVSLWGAGSTQPFVATLNDATGLIVANAAIVPAGTTAGGISVFNAGPSIADVIIDMNGYFAPPSSGLEFHPVPPCRLVDTRGATAGFNGIAPFSGPSLPSGGTLTIPVQSATEASTDTMPAPCGTIPSAAQAYSFNLTTVPHGGGAVNYVSLWPSGSARPVVATLNDPQGLIVANAAIVPAGTPSGGVSVFNAGPSTADIILDMNGYFAPPTTSLQFYPMPPCRLVDTRGAAAGFDGIAPFSGPSIASGGTLTIPVLAATQTNTTMPAACGVIPSTAQAYSLNLTVVPGGGSAVNFITLWPSGAAKPFVATLNDPQGAIVSNAAIVPAGTPNGGISVFNDGPGTADVVIDMDGYFAP